MEKRRMRVQYVPPPNPRSLRGGPLAPAPLSVMAGGDGGRGADRPLAQGTTAVVAAPPH